ncbi:ABC transporter ATP-binding protein [Paenibacillus tyrfis]|uniref:ABC transporter ATP-binding protein n=1 Tax=Paenibacillus tyrfis TaxID=1501230 RepID=UPI000AF7523A|nr:ABC transporter ATP-binding protein [Paenibacillus tyrfis]
MVKRLFGYVLLFRKKVALAVIILLLSIVTQLIGPYIIKVIIDQHINASTQLHWYQTELNGVPDGTSATSFQNKAYIRADWVNPGQIRPEWPKYYIKTVNDHVYLTSPDSKDVELSSSDVFFFYEHDALPVVLLIGLYIIVLIMSGYLAFLKDYLMQSAALEIIRKMRMDLIKQVHRLPVSYFDSTPIGQIVTRISNDIESIKEFFLSFMSNFVVNGVNLIGIYVLLFILDVKLAAVCLLLIPLFFFLMSLHLKYSKGYFQVMRARLSDMNAMLSETMQVMPIFKAFRREQAVIEEFEELNRERFDNQIKQLRVSNILSQNISNFVGALCVVAVMWYFGDMSLRSAISFGVLYAFIDYLGRLFAPINGIFQQLSQVQPAFIAAEGVFSLLDIEGTDIAAVNEVNRPEGHVKFSNVTFAYKKDEYVLKNISFEAKKGETIAIVGHTGSGKSSIMSLLMGFYEPTSGLITIDGQDITTISKQALRKYMGIVQQDPVLFAGDIKFNVSLYNEEIDLEKVKYAIREVGAEELVLRLPNGYDEEVIERGTTLSSGQRQLISFARALAFNPAIMILDEATSSIDTETEMLVQKALKVLVKDRTTFIIAHRLSTIRQADHILVLHQGEIVESGNHDELMSMKGKYYTMVQLQNERAVEEAMT